MNGGNIKNSDTRPEGLFGVVSRPRGRFAWYGHVGGIDGPISTADHATKIGHVRLPFLAAVACFAVLRFLVLLPCFVGGWFLNPAILPTDASGCVWS